MLYLLIGGLINMKVIEKQSNGLSRFITGVYAWMFIGLLVSGVTAYVTANTPSILKFVFSNFFLVIIAELIVVIAFSALLKKVSPIVAKLLFIIYAVINGLTLSSIFIVYELGSITLIFVSSAILFGALAIYGYTTNQDLTSLGRMMFFGLIAILIASLINLFVGNSTLDIILCVVGIVVFLALTAWDMQRIKGIYNSCEDDEMINKLSIYGALELYLDFINIFLRLLQLFGKSKD